MIGLNINFSKIIIKDDIFERIPNKGTFIYNNGLKFNEKETKNNNNYEMINAILNKLPVGWEKIENQE
jgi:hypothetical protein